MRVPHVYVQFSRALHGGWQDALVDFRVHSNWTFYFRTLSSHIHQFSSYILHIFEFTFTLYGLLFYMSNLKGRQSYGAPGTRSAVTQIPQSAPFAQTYTLAGCNMSHVLCMV